MLQLYSSAKTGPGHWGFLAASPATFLVDATFLLRQENIENQGVNGVQQMCHVQLDVRIYLKRSQTYKVQSLNTI